ncbi:MAG: insulinase family protein [bacterium]
MSVCLALPASLAPPRRPSLFDVQEKVLANGLRVYAVPCDSPGIVSYYTVVRTGSRQEIEPSRSGFAHFFFEHMTSGGTPTWSEEAYNTALKRIGADSNAWTWRDQTVYHISFTIAFQPCRCWSSWRPTVSSTSRVHRGRLSEGVAGGPGRVQVGWSRSLPRS